MKLRFLFLVASLTMSLGANAGIDFTASTNQRVLGGIRFTQLVFNENGRKITYEQPRGWTYTGSGDSIRFTPPNTLQAVADISQSSLPAPQVFNEEMIKQLRERTLAAVPNGGTKAAIVSEDANPVLVDNNQSYDITVSYEASGHHFLMSVVYLNLPKTEVRFRTIARREDFDKIHAAFRGSIFSWQWER